MINNGEHCQRNEIRGGASIHSLYNLNCMSRCEIPCLKITTAKIQKHSLTIVVHNLNRFKEA